MTTTLDEKVNQEHAEVLSKGCYLVDEWISKTDDMTAAERYNVEAYVEAKIEFLVKLEIIIVLLVEREKKQRVLIR